MKKRLFVISILFTALLTSCQKPTLRSDIAKFIASFSLETSLATYTHAEYKIVTTSVVNSTTKVNTETFTFNVENVDNLAYTKSIVISENGVQTSSTIETVNKNGEKYDFIKNGDVIEQLSSEQVRLLIRNYFYTTSGLDETYHEGGMFYGDYLRVTSLDYQNYVKIDEINRLYIRTLHLKGASQEGEKVDLDDVLKVNEIGMLESRDLTMQNENAYVSQIFTAYKL